MRNSSVSATLVLLLFTLAISSYAQNPGGAPGGVPGGIPDPNAPVSPEKAKAIRRLMELNGGVKAAQQILDQVTPRLRRTPRPVPDSVWAEIEKEFAADLSSGKFVERMIPLYSRYFTEADINELIKFYESPIGQKMARVLPQLAVEAMEVGGQWGLDVMKRIQQRLKEKGYSNTTE